MDEIDIINEDDDTSKDIQQEMDQFRQAQTKFGQKQNVPVGFIPMNKRNKYAKSGISSALVPTSSEVKVQAATPAKVGPARQAESYALNLEGDLAKGKSKRLNYGKKTWGSSPADSMLNNSAERFVRPMPMHYDPNLMGTNMLLRGTGLGPKETSGYGIRDGMSFGTGMPMPMQNMMPSLNYQMQNMQIASQNQYYQGPGNNFLELKIKKLK